MLNSHLLETMFLDKPDNLGGSSGEADDLDNPEDVDSDATSDDAGDDDVVIDDSDDSKDSKGDDESDDDDIDISDDADDDDPSFAEYYEKLTGKELPDGIETEEQFYKAAAEGELSSPASDDDDVDSRIEKALKKRGVDKDDSKLDTGNLNIHVPNINNAVNKLVADGKMTDTEADTYRAIGKVIDAEISPFVETMYSLISVLGKQLQDNTGRFDSLDTAQRDAAWGGFAKDFPGFKSKKTALTKILKANKDLNYLEAARLYTSKNPQYLTHLLSKKKGMEKQDEKRKLRSSRFKARGGAPKTISIKLNDYITMDGNLNSTKLAEELAAGKISKTLHTKICDAYLKKAEKQGMK